eukprot:g54109.t1
MSNSIRSQWRKWKLKRKSKRRKITRRSAVNKWGNSVLGLAAETKSLDEFRACLAEHRSSVNVQNKNGWTPLRCVIEARDDLHVSKVIAYDLLSAKADPFIGCRKGRLLPVHGAARNPQKSSVFLPLLIGKFPELAEAKTRMGLRPLHYAAEARDLPAVKWLVEHVRVDVDAVTNDGNTALHYAGAVSRDEQVSIQRFNKLPVWDYLVEHGASLEVRNHNGFSPIGKLFGPHIGRLQREAKEKKLNLETSSDSIVLHELLNYDEDTAEDVLNMMHEERPESWEPVPWILKELFFGPKAQRKLLSAFT